MLKSQKCQILLIKKGNSSVPSVAQVLFKRASKQYLIWTIRTGGLGCIDFPSSYIIILSVEDVVSRACELWLGVHISNHQFEWWLRSWGFYDRSRASLFPRITLINAKRTKRPWRRCWISPITITKHWRTRIRWLPSRYLQSDEMMTVRHLQSIG